MLFGCDFSSAPTSRKPIVVAVGEMAGTGDLALTGLQRFATLDAWGQWLRSSPAWVGGFDFPFSLPRELGRDLGWPAAWPELVAHCAAMSRHELRNILDAYRATRPVGNKYAHRATDLPAGSSSPMKLVNPPVALMFHEGAPRVLASGAHVPALSEGDRSRVALEAYPGLLVRKQLGIRESYKSDTKAEHTPARRNHPVGLNRAKYALRQRHGFQLLIANC